MGRKNVPGRRKHEMILFFWVFGFGFDFGVGCSVIVFCVGCDGCCFCFFFWLGFWR